FLSLARDYMHFDLWRVLHPCHCQIGVGRLLGGAVLESNFSSQGRRNTPDNSPFDLLLDPDWIDDQSAIDRRDHTLHFDVTVSINDDVDHVGDVRPAIINVAGYAAPMAFPGFPGPFRFIAHRLENAAERTTIVGIVAYPESVGTLQKLEAKRERIGPAFIRDFIDERFAGENARGREDGAPGPVQYRQIHWHIPGLDRRNDIRKIVNAP